MFKQLLCDFYVHGLMQITVSQGLFKSAAVGEIIGLNLDVSLNDLLVGVYR